VKKPKEAIIEMPMSELRALAASLLDEPNKEIENIKQFMDRLARRVADLENERGIISVDGEKDE
jgi:hypothetical protein